MPCSPTEHVPGPFFAPGTGYLSVGSRHRVGRREGTLAERRTWRGYHALSGSGEPVIEGDGLIPLASALLPGTTSLVFDDAAHGQGIGRDWYGSPRCLDRWWPLALEAWQAALRARVEDGWRRGAGGDPGDADDRLSASTGEDVARTIGSSARRVAGRFAGRHFDGSVDRGYDDRPIAGWSSGSSSGS